MDWRWALVAVAACFIASLALTRLVLGQLRRRAILDHPNARSSHAVPTPRGGGIALMAVTLVAWIAIARLVPATAPPLGWSLSGIAMTGWPAALVPIAAAALLALVSWLDDLGSLPILARLAAQIAAVALGIGALAGHGHVFQGLLPAWLDDLVAGFLWLWFVNLFNFMDGIDGIAASESAATGVGVALVTVALGLGGPPAYDGLAIAAASLGFLWWNWAPARVFLGDVGSVPLGYLLGWLLLELAVAGAWAPALILPLYYLADASLTLLRRILRGERFWRAHREHFYQRATARGAGGPGLTHAEAVRRIALLNLVLIVLALWAAREGTWLALLLAAASVGLVLVRFARRGVA